MIDTLVTYYSNNPVQSLIWLGMFYSLITLIERKNTTMHDYVITSILSLLLFLIFYTNINIEMKDIQDKLDNSRISFNKS